MGRQSGAIGVGQLADLVAVDDQSACLAGLSGDTLLDSLIFSGGDALVSDVWSAGRHVISQGCHTAHDEITANYKKTINRLTADL
jgi:formimidoylglutamate deiminase